MPKLKDIFGLCGYAWYGYGGHQSPGAQPFTIQGEDLVNASGKWISTVRAGGKFKIHRMFIDNWSIVPEAQPPFTIKLEPSEQNFYYDSFLRLQKANGITTIFSLNGCFDWYKPALGGNSQRKTMPYNPAMSPSDPAAWADYAHLCKLIAERYKDNGLLDYIQCGNEYDFRWNVPRILTPEEYAVGFWECYKAIRAVSTTQKIMSGCTLTADMATATRFIGAVDALAGNEGKPAPRDYVYTLNNYIRTGSQNQGDGIGATPEEVNRYGVFYKPLNDYLEGIGLDGFAVTETGYNSSPSTSAAAMKNKAPQLEGFTLEQAQGILAIRTALIIGSLPKCKAITFYHTKDGYEAEPFTYHGFSFDKDFGGKEDWSAKPARTICEAFLSKYGEFECSNFQGNATSNIYYVTFSNGKSLTWTDKVKIGTITPMPTETEPPQPPTMNLKVINKQLQWSDGQPCHLIHADSPESRLHSNYKAAFSAECKALPTKGINSITVTMRGDDVTAINPWINNTPSQGVDTAKLQTWHGQLKEFLTECEKNGLRGVIIAYLGERTNFKSITDAQYFAWIDAMAPIFQDISGSMIFGWEEIWDGSNSATMAFADRIGGYLKSVLPNCLLMVHNNPGQKPWQAASSEVDIICIQETSVSAMKASAVDALAHGYAVHFHELYPGFKLTNSQDTNKTLMKELCDAAMSIGCKNVGCFSSDYDLQSPDANKLGYLYTYQSQLLTGTIPPNPTPMKIQYTTANNHPANAPELTEGTSIIPGNYSVFTDVAGTFDLYKNNARQPGFPKSESQPPFDMWGTTGTSANLYPFTEGSWRLVFTPKTGTVPPPVNFTVGTITPPPTEVPGTGFKKTADGKIRFEFQDGSNKVVTPD